MKFAKHIFLCLVCAVSVQAETVYYTLDNVVLDDGTRMTGLFSWIYTPGDFENGAGQFLSLEIPHSSHNQDDLISTIETAQIEITFDGNVHDDGVDIKLVLVEPLTPTTSSLINTNHTESKYSIGGNGFNKGFFLGGSVSSVDIILKMTTDAPGSFALSWSPPVPGLLQQTPDLVHSNWVDAASGSTNPATLSVTVPAMFYRLVTP